jgi:hypothetical protein
MSQEEGDAGRPWLVPWMRGGGRGCRARRPADRAPAAQHRRGCGRLGSLSPAARASGEGEGELEAEFFLSADFYRFFRYFSFIGGVRFFPIPAKNFGLSRARHRGPKFTHAGPFTFLAHQNPKIPHPPASRHRLAASAALVPSSSKPPPSAPPRSGLQAAEGCAYFGGSASPTRRRPARARCARPGAASTLSSAASAPRTRSSAAAPSPTPSPPAPCASTSTAPRGAGGAGQGPLREEEAQA